MYINFKKFVPNWDKSICSGSFGEIYLAEQSSDFVVKVITASTKRSEIEGNPDLIEATKNCKYVVPILEVIWKPKLLELWIVMENLPGTDLFDLYPYNFSSNELLEITKQLLFALDHLHSNNVIHMDLKPENIRIIRNIGIQVKLYDFGLSRFVKNKIFTLYKNKDKYNPAGTIGFMAPEVLNIEVEYNEKADIWSLGAVLFILMTGKTPVQVSFGYSKDFNSLKYTNLFKNKLEISDEYDQGIRKLCLTMLEYDHNCRKSCKELLKIFFAE